jgi:hypothetical protein
VGTKRERASDTLGWAGADEAQFREGARRPLGSRPASAAFPSVCTRREERTEKKKTPTWDRKVPNQITICTNLLSLKAS